MKKCVLYNALDNPKNIRLAIDLICSHIADLKQEECVWALSSELKNNSFYEELKSVADIILPFIEGDNYDEKIDVVFSLILGVDLNKPYCAATRRETYSFEKASDFLEHFSDCHELADWMKENKNNKLYRKKINKILRSVGEYSLNIITE